MLPSNSQIIPKRILFSRPAIAASHTTDKSPVTDWVWFEEFLEKGGELASKQYAQWIKRRGNIDGWGALMNMMKAMEHKVLYSLHISDIYTAVINTQHALGRIDKTASTFKNIHNFTTPVPIIFIFHSILEKMKRIPTWQDVRARLLTEFRDLCWVPFCKQLKLNPDIRLEDQEQSYMEAFFWRMGNAYYSWLREVDLITYLRRIHRLDLRYHFLVDAEWRADFVAGTTLLELFVKNKEFKDDDGGRKLTCAKINPKYDVLEVKLDTAPSKVGPKFGKPWVVSDECKLYIAQELIARKCPYIQN